MNQAALCNHRPAAEGSAIGSTWVSAAHPLLGAPAKKETMNAVTTTIADDAPPPVEHEGYIFGPLLMLTRARTQSASTSHAAAILLAYVLRIWAARKGWVNGSRRRIAKAARLTEWEVRVAFDQLVKWGWIERRQTANHASVHFRLTPAFAETVELASEEVSGILRQCIPLGATPNEPRADATPISPEISERLCAYAWQHLMQRFLTLNERTKRYGRGYSKPHLAK